jgi:hypothetical protein
MFTDSAPARSSPAAPPQCAAMKLRHLLPLPLPAALSGPIDSAA